MKKVMQFGGRPWSLGRRRVLKMGALWATAWFAPHALAGPRKERSLGFLNLHTKEVLETVYWSGGEYRATAIEAINHILRDHRADVACSMDLGLLDLLYALKRKLGAEDPFQVISGYRTPETNAWLRKKRGGVAKHSLHVLGKAVDLMLPSHSLRQLHRAAQSLQAGGVGYYPGSGFVHLDVGRVRHWRG